MVDEQKDKLERRDSSTKLLLTLSVISFISGLLIVSAVQLTQEPIRLNKEEMVRKSIVQLFPATETTRKFEYQELLEPNAPADERLNNGVFYSVRNASKELIGLAIEASGMGFQDVIKIIYAYDLKSQSIAGMIVLDSKETPGLGDKIEKDESFKKNFLNLPVNLNLQAGFFEMVKKNLKTAPSQIEAITGATISSKAITKILNNSAALQLKLIANNLDKIESAN